MDTDATAPSHGSEVDAIVEPSRSKRRGCCAQCGDVGNKEWHVMPGDVLMCPRCFGLQDLYTKDGSLDMMNTSKRRRSAIPPSTSSVAVHKETAATANEATAHMAEGDAALRSAGDREPEIVEEPVFSRKGCCTQCGTMTKITDKGLCRKCHSNQHLYDGTHLDVGKMNSGKRSRVAMSATSVAQARRPIRKPAAEKDPAQKEPAEKEPAKPEIAAASGAPRRKPPSRQSCAPRLAEREVAVWTGPVVREQTNGDTYRLSFFRGGEHYRLGDSVVLYAENGNEKVERAITMQALTMQAMTV